MSNGNVENGKKIFMNRCAQCHTIDPEGKHMYGPNLFGVYGARAGQKPGYSYTNEMKNKGIRWTNANLTKFLENPKKFIPGTSMFTITKNKQDKADIIAFLRKSV